MNNKCFGARGKNGCKILVVKKCPGTSCSYFKTKAEYRSGRLKAFRRLAGLDKEYQSYIAGKYYRGRMPWLTGGAGCDC
ncbi:MAG TPA: hypothetical protein DCR71_01275 [Dehalococcoidia bacterium]|nr:hypothetical protein [Dehalococcoidia bacterium]